MKNNSRPVWIVEDPMYPHSDNKTPYNPNNNNNGIYDDNKNKDL